MRPKTCQQLRGAAGEVVRRIERGAGSAYRVNGRDVGLVQIERGLGWHYKRYEKEQSPDDRLAYAAAEREARAAHRGLWVDRAPVPPWDWRHAKRFPLRPDPLGRLRPGSLESEARP